MYRVAVILQSGVATSKEFQTTEEVLSWLIDIDYKRYKVLDKETGKIIDRYLK